MRMLEKFNYSEMKFKEEAKVFTSDIENKFINEDMILQPLYKKIKIDKNTKIYNFLPYNDIRVECYCKECNKRRIFAFEDSNAALNSLMVDCMPESMTSGRTTVTKNSMEYFLSETDFFNFCAIADCKHKMMITFMKIDNETIMKIGQIPSIYDLNEKINNKNFLKILGDEYADYYKKACSLYSFNTYIGALIYLRRIFEKLLIDTFNDNEDETKMDFDEFMKERMENKIKILKQFLPSIMFNQGFNKIYTKLSDGIHNLNEDECSKMFLVIKMGIEEILTEKMEKVEKNKRLKELSKQLQNI